MDLMTRWFAAASRPFRLVTETDPGTIDAAVPKIERLAVTFLPIQSGSGDPSPTNVRTITGWTSISASIGANTFTTALGGTYYGGTVDLVSGTLTVTHKVTTFNSSASVSTTAQVGDGVRTWLRDTTVNYYTDISHNMASYLKHSEAATPATTYVPWSWYARSDYPDYIICWFPYGSEGITDATNDGVKAYLGNHPLQVYGKLKTAQTVQLSPQTINALTGQQSVSGDGSIEISYYTI